MARRIVVQFIGDARSLNRATDSAGDATTRLSDRMRAVAKVAGFALAAGAVMAAKGLYSATKAAIADSAAQAKLAQGLKNAAGANDAQVAATERWISAQGRALGVTDDELRPALSRLVTATKDVEEAQRLAALSMDVSAGSGKSLESVSTAMMKAANGNVSALSRLGINTKNAAGETISFEEATRRMAETFGGQAATKANTLEGKMARLRLIFDETKETIGMKLIPVLTDLADWFLTDGLPAISRTATLLKATLGPAFTAVAAIASRASALMRGDVTKNVGVIGDIFRSVADIARSLWARFGTQIVAITTAAFETLRAVVKGALLIIRGIVRVVSGLLKGDWARVWAGIKDILRGAVGIIIAVIKNSLALLKNVWRAAWGIIRDVVKGIWSGIKSAVSAGVDRVVDAVGNLKDRFVNTLKTLPERATSIGRDIIGGILAGLRARAGEVMDYLRSLAADALKAVKDKLGIASPSKAFAEVGGQSAEGYVKGWESWRKDLVNRPRDLVGASRDAVAATAASVTRATSRPAASAAPGQTVPATQVIKLILDGRTLSQALARYGRLVGA